MDLKNIAGAIANFSARFCYELEKDKSVVSSPLSAEILLSLIALGTTDPAHSELLKALSLSDDDYIRSSFTKISKHLKSVKGVKLNVANKVYLKEGNYELLPQLKQDAEKVFDAGIEKVNFDDSSAAAHHINKWVESKTNNHIKDLLSSDFINSDTRLVLVNALYFKGNWKHKFDVNFTRDLPFHVNSQNTINIPMMYMEKQFLYGESQELDAKLLEMPYEGGDASMLVVLPNEVEGLGPLMKKLANGFDLLSAVNKMHSIKVQVTLPKFKIETEIDLNDILPKLGIKAIFDPKNSGLTKILNNNESLFVSKAIQKAFIEVNEEGAEAAAATAFGITMCSAVIDFDPVQQFVADRPFLTIILVDKIPYFLAVNHGDN